jgi:hypothetical protein
VRARDALQTCGPMIKHQRVVVVSEKITEALPARVREGIARRRLVVTTGHCPCGAMFRRPDPIRAGTVTVIAIEHTAGCPAIESVEER